jgi:hypothetical protein
MPDRAASHGRRIVYVEKLEAGDLGGFLDELTFEDKPLVPRKIPKRIIGTGLTVLMIFHSENVRKMDQASREIVIVVMIDDRRTNIMHRIGYPCGANQKLSIQDDHRGIAILHHGGKITIDIVRKAKRIKRGVGLRIDQYIFVEQRLPDNKPAGQGIERIMIEPAIGIDQPVIEREEMRLYGRFRCRLRVIDTATI